MDPAPGKSSQWLQDRRSIRNTYNTVTDPRLFSNPLIEGRYELGSIMKPLTMAAGIDSGAVTLQTTYKDTDAQSGAAEICDFDQKARGVLPMQEILNQSLNLGAHSSRQTGHLEFTNYCTIWFC